MSKVFQRVTATSALAVSVFGVMAATAPQALAGDETSAVQAGNTAVQPIGNTTSNGYLSPNMAIVNGGILNCASVQQLDTQVPVAVLGLNVLPVQDVLNTQAGQVCSPGAQQQTGDGALANVLKNVLSAT